MNKTYVTFEHYSADFELSTGDFNRLAVMQLDIPKAVFIHVVFEK